MAVTEVHPGKHLTEELKELGISAAELARKLNVPTNRITGILNGQRAITGDTALRLAHFFGTSAEFWLNLQSLYELRVAQKKVGKSIKALPRLKHSERVPA
jgi:antitoxin HigA-1